MGGGRDKRKKAKPSAPGAGSAKTERKTALADEKRQRRAERGADEDDIEALLARARLEDAASTEVRVEADATPPSARVSASLTALGGAGGKAAQLLLFGGESTDAAGQVRVFGDTYLFDTAKRSWSLIRSPGAPPPRSAHQAAAYKHFVYVFGGEFTSPNQARAEAGARAACSRRARRSASTTTRTCGGWTSPAGSGSS